MQMQGAVFSRMPLVLRYEITCTESEESSWIQSATALSRAVGRFAFHLTVYLNYRRQSLMAVRACAVVAYLLCWMQPIMSREYRRLVSDGFRTYTHAHIYRHVCTREYTGKIRTFLYIHLSLLHAHVCMHARTRRTYTRSNDVHVIGRWRC